MTSTKENVAQNKATIRRVYDICLNRRDLLGAESLISPEFSSADGDGVAGFLDTARRLHAAFNPLTFTLVTMLAENSHVAVRWRMSGVHTGNWMGMAATGKPIDIYANVLYELSEGKILHAWPQVDSLALLRQLGALNGKPAPATAPEKQGEA